MTKPFRYPERDHRGRFLPGNSLATRGGQTRARALTPERRREIARLGFRAMVARRFDGDRQAAVDWLAAKGRWANDQDMSPELRKFADPGPMPQPKL